jgi:hypothetical protein
MSIIWNRGAAIRFFTLRTWSSREWLRVGVAERATGDILILLSSCTYKPGPGFALGACSSWKILFAERGYTDDRFLWYPDAIVSNPQKIPAEDPLRRLLENAPVDDEEVTEEDLALIQEGIEEHAKGETLSQEEVERLFLKTP